MNKSSLALWVVLAIVGFSLIGNGTELASGKERPLVVGPFPVRLNPRASQKDRVWTSSSVGLSARRLIARRPQDMVSTAFWSTRSARRCGSPPRRRRTRRTVCAIRAADLAPDAFMLDVRVKKGELKTLRFAIDVEGKGVLDDVVEYDVKTNGVIVKLPYRGISRLSSPLGTFHSQKAT